MRLSDAIALGRTTVEKMKSVDLSRCALGMALNAVGEDPCYHLIPRVWPWLASLGPHCSRCTGFSHLENQGSGSSVYFAFDYHVMMRNDMTLDQLIDWVRSVEPAEEETPISNTETVQRLEMEAAKTHVTS